MKIQVSIAGYGGVGAEPVTLLAQRNEATSVLAIVKKVQYRTAPDVGFAFVTNLKLDNYDCLFQEEHLNGAIQAYKEAEGMGMIVLGPDVAKYAPRIAVDGIDMNGQKYRLHENMSNGEMAILALAHFMTRQKAITAREGQADKLFSMYEIFSV